MAGLKRRILGITVISVGVCAALPFRNEPASAPLDKDKAVDFPAAGSSRNELTLQLAMPPSPNEDPATVREPAPTIAMTQPVPKPQEVRRDELQAPPSIASAFQPLMATIPAATFPVSTAEVIPAIRRDQPIQRHRIVDGDTLPALAERYLGDRDQWRSIWEANGGLLADPNLLPIGEVLLIPQRHDASRTDELDNHLVPVPRELLSREE